MHFVIIPHVPRIEQIPPGDGITAQVDSTLTAIIFETRVSDEDLGIARDNKRGEKIGGLESFHNYWLSNALYYRKAHPDSGIKLVMEGTQNPVWIHPFSQNRFYLDFSGVQGVERGVTFFVGNIGTLARTRGTEPHRAFNELFEAVDGVQQEDPSHAAIRIREEIRNIERYYRSSLPDQKQNLSSLRDSLLRILMKQIRKGASVETFVNGAGKNLVFDFGYGDRIIVPFKGKFEEMADEEHLGV